MAGYRITIATAVAIVLAGIALLLPVVSYRLELPPDEGAPPARLELVFKGITPLVDHKARVVVSTRTDGDWQEQSDGEAVLPIVVDSSAAARTFTLVGLVLLVAGALAAFLRSAPARALASAAGALLGGTALFVAALDLRRSLVDIGNELSAGSTGGAVGYRLGFWVAMGLLLVVASGNLALAIMRKPATPAPAVDTPAVDTPAVDTPAVEAPAAEASADVAAPAEVEAEPAP